jgi:hypothetical protein
MLVKSNWLHAGINMFSVTLGFHPNERKTSEPELILVVLLRLYLIYRCCCTTKRDLRYYVCIYIYLFIHIYIYIYIIYIYIIYTENKILWYWGNKWSGKYVELCKSQCTLWGWSTLTWTQCGANLCMRFTVSPLVHCRCFPKGAN